MAYGHENKCPHPGHPCNCKMSEPKEPVMSKPREFFGVTENFRWYDGELIVGVAVYEGNQSRDGLKKENIVAIFKDHDAAINFIFETSALDKLKAEKDLCLVTICNQVDELNALQAENERLHDQWREKWQAALDSRDPLNQKIEMLEAKVEALLSTLKDNLKTIYDNQKLSQSRQGLRAALEMYDSGIEGTAAHDTLKADDKRFGGE